MSTDWQSSPTTTSRSAAAGKRTSRASRRPTSATWASTSGRASSPTPTSGWSPARAPRIGSRPGRRTRWSSRTASGSASRGSARCLEPARDPVDGQLDEAQELIALRVVSRASTEPAQQHHLHRRERVDVRVAKDDPAAQLEVACEELLATGDPEQPRHGPAVLRLDRRPAPRVLVGRADRERRVLAGDADVGAGEGQLRVVEQAREERPRPVEPDQLPFAGLAV